MTDLFDGTKPKEDGTPATPVEGAETIDTYLGLILNDEGTQKYATAEEALKGSVHAQSHITKLESELKELREHAGSDESMKKILEALEKKPVEPTPAQPASEGITPEQLAEAFTKMSTERDSVQTEKQNVATVTSYFSELYGDKASEIMYGKADDLGFTQTEINSMIATNPKAVLKILGGDKTPLPKDPLALEGLNIPAGGGEPDEVGSSMGYLKTGELEANWKASQAATLKRLEAQGL